MDELNIRHFKLLNGEDIVGLVAVKNDDNFIVERPVSVNTNLLGGFQFSPWFPFSEAKQFKILKANIIQHVPVANEVKNTYVQFALKMEKAVIPESKSDLEILEEYENDLINQYADEGVPIPEKKTIH
jgi:hypothetical protein